MFTLQTRNNYYSTFFVLEDQPLEVGCTPANRRDDPISHYRKFKARQHPRVNGAAILAPLFFT
jgi:hypothetical protein